MVLEVLQEKVKLLEPQVSWTKMTTFKSLLDENVYV